MSKWHPPCSRQILLSGHSTGSMGQGLLHRPSCHGNGVVLLQSKESGDPKNNRTKTTCHNCISLTLTDIVGRNDGVQAIPLPRLHVCRRRRHLVSQCIFENAIYEFTAPNSELSLALVPQFQGRAVDSEIAPHAPPSNIKPPHQLSKNHNHNI